MRYTKVHIAAVGYELAPQVVTSTELERRLRPAYEALHIAPGQLQALTGIVERRWWNPGQSLAAAAAQAARKALMLGGVRARELEAVIYAGVCREQHEPATACEVADRLGVRGAAVVHDISNACLGVLNGILDIANRIELGQIRAGLVVACESSREINETMLQRLLKEPSMPLFTTSLATFTGGSGAAAVLITSADFAGAGARLLGATQRAEPAHHRLCRWGTEAIAPDHHMPYMRTDAVGVMNHGVELGQRTWRAFTQEMGFHAEDVDRVVCHQVGEAHQRMILQTLGIPAEKDFCTFSYLGNMGTVSLPATAAIAAEQGHLRPGQLVAMLGIGSGLNCMMLALQWA